VPPVTATVPSVTPSGVQSFWYRGGAQRASLSDQIIVLHPDEVHDGGAGTETGLRYRTACSISTRRSSAGRSEVPRACLSWPIQSSPIPRCAPACRRRSARWTQISTASSPIRRD
jgi:hypothetical protein